MLLLLSYLCIVGVSVIFVLLVSVWLLVLSYLCIVDVSVIIGVVIYVWLVSVWLLLLSYLRRLRMTTQTLELCMEGRRVNNCW